MFRSKSTFMNRMERWIRRYKGGNNGLSIQLKVNPYIRNYLTEGFISKIARMKMSNFLFIKLEEDEALALDEFKVYSKKLNKDITEEFDY